MYGIRQCNRIFLCGEIGAFFTEIFFQISVVILNSTLHYQIFKFVIDNSDISLNCLQHIQKRRNFDAKVTCHQPICLLLHAILSGVGVGGGGMSLAHKFATHPRPSTSKWTLHNIIRRIAPCNISPLLQWLLAVARAQRGGGGGGGGFVIESPPPVLSLYLCQLEIADFRNLFKFHAYSVNKRLFLPESCPT